MNKVQDPFINNEQMKKACESLKDCGCVFARKKDAIEATEVRCQLNIKKVSWVY